VPHVEIDEAVAVGVGPRGRGRREALALHRERAVLGEVEVRRAVVEQELVPVGGVRRSTAGEGSGEDVQVVVVVDVRDDGELRVASELAVARLEEPALVGDVLEVLASAVQEDLAEDRRRIGAAIVARVLRPRVLDEVRVEVPVEVREGVTTGDDAAEPHLLRDVGEPRRGREVLHLAANALEGRRGVGRVGGVGAGVVRRLPGRHGASECADREDPTPRHARACSKFRTAIGRRFRPSAAHSGLQLTAAR